MKEASELKPILKIQPTEKELCKSLLKALFFLPVFIYFPRIVAIPVIVGKYTDVSML
jgi:hypothetical protein